MKLPVFRTEFVNAQEFINFWSSQYKYKNEHIYDDNIGKELNEVYGKYIKLFSLFGLIKKDDGDEIFLSDKGIFWLHALEDLFSIDYISKLWGTSKQEPWPEKIIL